MVTYIKLYKIFIPFVAVMILASSISYSIDYHYCQGQLKSFSLIGKAKNCHEMASKKPSCHHKKQGQNKSLSCSSSDNNCCNNKTVHVESDFNKKILNVLDLNIQYQFFVVANTLYSFKNLFVESTFKAPFVYYKPPLIRKDISVFYEVFLL